MNRIIGAMCLVCFLLGCVPKTTDVFLFSFFQGNGEDGLHLAASEDGYQWTALNNNESFLTPAVGHDQLMRDPCIIRGGDGLFHMVWTVSWGEPGIGYAHSEDLVNWSEQVYLPVMHHEPDVLNCWAPELFYEKEKNQYMIYWASTIPGRFPATDSSGNKNYNHRMYYTKTNDFVEFTETKLLFDQGFNVIDATIVKDKDGYVMFLKNETQRPKPEKNIRVSFSKSLTQDYTEASSAISADWVEGPTVTKIDNLWTVYFDQYTRHRMGAIQSSDLKNWTDISDQISFPDGTRHGTVFRVNQQVLQEIRRSLSQSPSAP